MLVFGKILRTYLMDDPAALFHPLHHQLISLLLKLREPSCVFSLSNSQTITVKKHLFIISYVGFGDEIGSCC